MAIHRALRRYIALDAADRRLVWRAFFWLGLMSLSLRTIGFKRVLRRLASHELAPDVEVTPQELRRAVRYGRWLAKVARVYLLPAHCLERSLVLHAWLLQEGLPSVLRIGVTKDGDALKAHAWIELGGVVVNDRNDVVAAFQPLVGWAGRDMAPSTLLAHPTPQFVTPTPMRAPRDLPVRGQHRG